MSFQMVVYRYRLQSLAACTFSALLLCSTGLLCHIHPGMGTRYTRLILGGARLPSFLSFLLDPRPCPSTSNPFRTFFANLPKSERLDFRPKYAAVCKFEPITFSYGCLPFPTMSEATRIANDIIFIVWHLFLKAFLKDFSADEKLVFRTHV